VGQRLGIGVAVGVEPVDAGALDHPHDPVAQDLALAGAQALDLDEARHQAGHRPLGLVDQLGELRVPHEAPAVEELEGVAVAAHVVEVAGEPELDHLPGPVRGGDGLGDLVLQVTAHVGEQLGEELALGGEVLVEDGLGHTGGDRDVVHRRVVVPLLGEDPKGDLQQLATAASRRQAGGYGGLVLGVRHVGPLCDAVHRGYLTVTVA
jgi:hypothetical protein